MYQGGRIPPQLGQVDCPRHPAEVNRSCSVNVSSRTPSAVVAIR
jgi:hypothetical protein